MSTKGVNDGSAKLCHSLKVGCIFYTAEKKVHSWCGCAHLLTPGQLGRRKSHFSYLCLLRILLSVRVGAGSDLKHSETRWNAFYFFSLGTHVWVCVCVPTWSYAGVCLPVPDDTKIILTFPPYPLRERLSVKPGSLVWLDSNRLVWGFPLSTFPGHNYKQAAIAIQHFYGKCWAISLALSCVFCLFCWRYFSFLGVVVHALNPSRGRGKQICEIQDSLNT